MWFYVTRIENYLFDTHPFFNATLGGEKVEKHIQQDVDKGNGSVICAADLTPKPLSSTFKETERGVRRKSNLYGAGPDFLCIKTMKDKANQDHVFVDRGVGLKN